MKRIRKKSLEESLKSNGNVLLALSIFLLIALTVFGMEETPLSRELAMLASFIAYILLIHIVDNVYERDDFLLGMFNSILVLFIIVFWIWVILNLILPVEGFYDNVLLFIATILILAAPIKLFIKRK